MADSASCKDLIEQFASEVKGFSSQYGNERNVSYIVPNLAGSSNIYPKYGDFTQACVFRTYGPWWQRSPSRCTQVPRHQDFFNSIDFVELEFSNAVYPTKIEIFETYNPGAVVRILACSETDDHSVPVWKTLWKGYPVKERASSRIFSPNIHEIDFKTKLIRLEINSSLVSYYTELDAVRLTGSSTVSEVNINGIARSLTNLDIQESTQEIREEAHANIFNFCLLPNEIIQKILTFLDLKSICQLAVTCKKLQGHCYEPLQYEELNLQPFWATVSNETLKSLSHRCDHLKRLCLNWCGRQGLMTSAMLSEDTHGFFQKCGLKLTCLQLANCSFVDSNMLQTIAKYCPLLEELDLQSNQAIFAEDFWNIGKLSRLRKLNLYRTLVDVYSIVIILRACTDLEHLNLGSCRCIDNFDQVGIELGKYTKNLKSVDFWRSHTLTEVGLMGIVENCSEMEEFDLGWCTGLRSVTGCLINLAKKCHKLKKLFLPANRTLTNADLFALAQFCPDLRQLDVLGTREITPNGILRVIESCKNLEFIDVSFCENLDMALIDQWRRKYPSIDFKQSF